MTGSVLIVGAGPAGLSAAISLAPAGLAVTVIDREAQAGGIPRHCGHYPFGWREYRRPMRGPDYAKRLVADALAAGVTFRLNTTATAILPGAGLVLSGPDGMTEARADRILIATGVRETPRAGRMIGGTKPGGVMTVGTLQTMVYGSGLRPFRRPLILGTELVAFSALMTCAHAGITPVAMIEPGPRATARWPAALYPRIKGIPLWTGCDVLQIHGREQVTGVTLQRGGKIWTEACDGLVTSGRFRPDAVLIRDSGLGLDPLTKGPDIDSHGRTSDPLVFAAGNLLRGAETAGHCWAEGRSVAGSILASLAGTLPQPGPRITVSGDGLAWVLPQHPGAGALPNLTLRVDRALRGTLQVNGPGGSVSFAISSLPERRITLPGRTLPQGPLTLSLREEA